MYIEVKSFIYWTAICFLSLMNIIQSQTYFALRRYLHRILCLFDFSNGSSNILVNPGTLSVGISQYSSSWQQGKSLYHASTPWYFLLWFRTAETYAKLEPIQLCQLVSEVRFSMLQVRRVSLNRLQKWNYELKSEDLWTALILKQYNKYAITPCEKWTVPLFH